MPSDPRCPRCNGKVSATATWCMHCQADFADQAGSQRMAVRDGAADDVPTRLVGSFDRNDGTRQVLAIVVTVAALIPVLAVGASRGGVGIALAGTVALAVYLRLCGSAKRIVVHGAYGTASLIAALHLVATDLATANPPGALLDGPVLLIVALLVAAGLWTDRRISDHR